MRGRVSPLALAAVLATAAAACSSGDDSAPTPTSRSAPTTATTAPSSTSTTTTTSPGPADQTGAVDQAPPKGTNGIVATSERLYVADLAGGEIVAADPQTGEITARWGKDQGVDGPDDVALGPDGDLYFTSFTTGAVGRIAIDGTVTTVATLAPGANPIAFSSDGRLFVGLAVIADGLWEIDPAGAKEPRRVAESLGNVNAFAIGADGFLYGPRFGLDEKGAVVRVDVESGAATVVATGLTYPVAVRFDPQGALFVAHNGPPAILRVDADAGTLEKVADIPHGIDNFAFAPDGRLYVTSFNQPVVSEVRADGTTRRLTLGSP